MENTDSYPSFGSHRLIRTFKPSPDAAFGYVDAVLTGVDKGPIFLTLRAHEQHLPPHYNARTATLAAQIALAAWLSAGCKVVGKDAGAVILRLDPQGRSFIDFLKGLAPADPEREAALRQAMYLS